MEEAGGTGPNAWTKNHVHAHIGPVDTIGRPLLCDYPHINPPVRINLGLRQLAYAMFRNAIEDCAGRGEVGTRRAYALDALTWLRSGLKPGAPTPGTPHWVGHILGIDTRKLVLYGVARPAGGLKDWRK